MGSNRTFIGLLLFATLTLAFLMGWKLFRNYQSPRIFLCGISAPELAAMSDSLVLCIEYEDNNGDIGGTGKPSLFLRDGRNGLEIKYDIQKLLPDSLHGAVRGKLHAVIGFIPLMGDTGAEKFSYLVWLKDRHGNSSNQLETPVITLKPSFP